TQGEGQAVRGRRHVDVEFGVERGGVEASMTATDHVDVDTEAPRDGVPLDRGQVEVGGQVTAHPGDVDQRYLMPCQAHAETAAVAGARPAEGQVEGHVAGRRATGSRSGVVGDRCACAYLAGGGERPAAVWRPA